MNQERPLQQLRSWWQLSNTPIHGISTHIYLKPQNSFEQCSSPILAQLPTFRSLSLSNARAAAPLAQAVLGSRCQVVYKRCRRCRNRFSLLDSSPPYSILAVQGRDLNVEAGYWMRTSWYPALYTTSHCWCSIFGICHCYPRTPRLLVPRPDPSYYEDICAQIEAALRDFHVNKHTIIEAKARRGKGNSVIDNWHIPKLEFLQSVVSNIRLNGVAIQWSADLTENAHISVVKDPGCSGNNKDYKSQICRSLDRSDKIWQFDLATAIQGAHIDFHALFDSENDPPILDTSDDDSDSELDVTIISCTSALLKNINLVSPLLASSRTVDYFDLASQLHHSSNTSLRPLRTQTSSQNVAFHLTCDASFKRMSVDDGRKCLICLIFGWRWVIIWFDLLGQKESHLSNLLVVGDTHIRGADCPLGTLKYGIGYNFKPKVIMHLMIPFLLAQ